MEDVDENGEHVRPKETQRVLGVTFSQGLNWEEGWLAGFKIFTKSSKIKISECTNNRKDLLWDPYLGHMHGQVGKKSSDCAK